MSKRVVLAIQMDESELTARMMEAAGQVERRSGQSAREFIAECHRLFTADGNRDGVPSFRRAAVAAIRYLGECLEDGKRPS